MKHYIKKTLLLASLVTMFSPFLHAEQIIHYKNEPVTIPLIQGQERTIQFGDHVQVGVTKGQQMQKLFRLQSAQGAVFIKPYKEFDKQRITIKRITDGRIILIDLVSEKGTQEAQELEKVKVLLETDNVVLDPQVKPSIDQHLAVITPVDLTRYAAQRLYGPTRLHNDVMGITEVSMGVKSSIKIFKGENKYRTFSKPIIAYQGGGYYLSGIHIKNVSSEPLKLDYLDLNLPFTHATFQHHTLSPNGTPGDSTVLYLLAEKPLKETLYPWTYYLDVQADAQEAVRRAVAEKKASEVRRKRLRRDN
jgi:integrating conjugative element protein (TIGR03749 family)